MWDCRRPTYAEIGASLTLYARGAARYRACLSADEWCVLTGSPLPDYNQMLLAPGASAWRVATAVARLRAHDVPGVLWLPGPADDRAAAARDAGLVQVGAEPLMVLDADALNLDALAQAPVEPVCDAAGLAAANRLIAGAFALDYDAVAAAATVALLDGPGVSVYLLRRDGRPISTVAVVRAGRLAGIWCMATEPGLQRRGVGRALLETVVATHARRGVRRFFLIATPAGRPLYDAIGFVVREELPVYLADVAGAVP